jgi:hypothetical protein
LSSPLPQGAADHLAPKADALTSAHSFEKGTLAETRRGLVLVPVTRLVAGFLCSSMRGLVFSNSPAVSWLPVGGSRMRLEILVR